MKKSVLFGIFASAALMLTSCLSSTESQGQVDCFCTISNTSNKTVLHVDGGGTVYPTDESIYNLLGLNGFTNIKRARAILTYPESGLGQDASGAFEVRNASLQYVEMIPVEEFISTKEAEIMNLLEKDSLADVVSINSFYPYNGYFTATYQSKYYIRSSKGIYPTMNLIVEQDANNPLVLNARCLLNLHPLNDSSKESLQNTPAVFISSFDIRYMLNQFNLPTSGIDSLTVNLKAQNLPDKTYKFPLKSFVRQY